jgi:small redox-active disulfide protein 2
MNIKILGSGCPNCNKLEANAKQAATNLGIAATFTKITNFNEMMAYGIMSTPALVIDNKVVSIGRVLSVQEIEKLIK